MIGTASGWLERLVRPFQFSILIMNDQRKVRPQIFCLCFSSVIESDIDTPLGSFLHVNNTGLFKIRKGRNGLICFWFNYSDLSDSFDPDGMLKRGALRIVFGRDRVQELLFARFHAERAEQRARAPAFP